MTTVKEFVEEKKIPLHYTTVKRWIEKNKDDLKEVVLFKSNEKRTTIRILDGEKLFEIFKGMI